VVASPKVQRDPLGFWLGRLQPNTQRTVISDFNRFLEWLHTHEEWHGVDARGLIIRQLESDDPYEVLTLLQEYLATRKLTKNTNQRTYGSIRSYFLHNRCPLPQERFRVPGFRPPTLGRLTDHHVARIVAAAKPRDRSLILVKWMGLLDTEGVMWVGENLSDHIVSAIEAHECPIRIDLPGRKHMENERRFYSFLGKDAIDMLVQYFEKDERGWPRKGEPLWLNKFGKPMRARTWPEFWLDLIRRAGLIPKMPQHDQGHRYGYNSHEMRDAARSLLHTRAKKDGLDLECAEFWMGHTVDPLQYDKFYMDQDYMTAQYRIAEKHLNIISNPQVSSVELQKRDREFSELREKHDRLEELVQKIASGEYTPPTIKIAKPDEP